MEPEHLLHMCSGSPALDSCQHVLECPAWTGASHSRLLQYRSDNHGHQPGGCQVLCSHGLIPGPLLFSKETTEVTCPKSHGLRGAKSGSKPRAFVSNDSDIPFPPPKKALLRYNSHTIKFTHLK